MNQKILTIRKTANHGNMATVAKPANVSIVTTINGFHLTLMPIPASVLIQRGQQTTPGERA